MSTVKFINEIIYSKSVFQLVPYNLKYINVTQSFTGNGIAGNCFHQFHFWNISLASSTGDGKSYSYQQQSNAALVAINDKNCPIGIRSFDSFRSKFFAKLISRFKSFSLNQYDLWTISSVFLMEMFELRSKELKYTKELLLNHYRKSLQNSMRL